MFLPLTMFSRYSESDIIPCSADEPAEDRARQALRGAVLRYCHYFNVIQQHFKTFENFDENTLSSRSYLAAVPLNPSFFTDIPCLSHCRFWQESLEP